MRKLDEIIIHCSATPEGRDDKFEDVEAWHLAKGWKPGSGYHFVIELDGTVRKGRPLSQPGAHVKGRNKTTIGICYIGGMTADMTAAKDTRTPAQRTALRLLLLDLGTKYGITKISGHNQYANKACPSFNAGEEYKDLLSMGSRHQEKDPSDLRKSRTLTGAGAAACGTVGAQLTDAATQIEAFTDFSDLVKWAFIALTVGGILLTVYARLDDAGLFTREKK